MKNWVLHFPYFAQLGERTLTKGTNRIMLRPFLGLEEAALGVMGCLELLRGEPSAQQWEINDSSLAFSSGSILSSGSVTRDINSNRFNSTDVD